MYAVIYAAYVCLLQGCGFGAIGGKFDAITELYKSVNIFWPQHAQFLFCTW